MKSEAQQRESTLEAAVDIASGEERRLCDGGAWAGEAELQARVEALIETHSLAGSFLESPAVAPVPPVRREGALGRRHPLSCSATRPAISCPSSLGHRRQTTRNGEP